MSRVLLYAALGLAFALFIGSWVYTSGRYVEDIDWVPQKKEARLNPFLAMELFLSKMGRNVQTVDMGDLDKHMQASPEAVVIVGASRRYLDTSYVERWLSWVSGGGTLIVAALPPRFKGDIVARADPLVARLGLEYIPVQPLETELEHALLDLTGARFASENFNLSFDEDDYEGQPAMDLRVASRDGFAFIDAAHAPPPDSLNDEEFSYEGWLDELGAQSYVFWNETYGGGELSLLTSLGFWENLNFQSLDHAQFAWAIASGAPRQEIFLVSRVDPPGVLSWVWENARTASILLTLLSLFALWFWGLRRGRTQEELKLDRRRFGEHLEASGTFYLRDPEDGTMPLATRRAVNKALLCASPRALRLSLDEQAQILAERSGMPLEKVLKIWKNSDAQSVLEEIRILEQLRRTL